MPKHKKEKAGPQLRHQPLATQIALEGNMRRNGLPSKSDVAKNPARAKGDTYDDDDDGDAYLPPDMTRKILEQARQQRDEMEDEEADGASATLERTKRSGMSQGTSVVADPLSLAGKRPRFSAEPASSEDGDGSDDEEDEDSDEMGDEEDVDGRSIRGVGMSEGEERLVASFMNSAPTQRRTLADIILEKIREKEEREAREAAGIVEEEGPRLPAKVVEVYSAIGRMLRTYTAGKLPKAFKIIPSLTNWEQVLWLTKPESWSNQASLAATKVFASNFNAKMAQRFYNVFLLEMCRSDIQNNKRLNYHLYEALRKSVYKPSAFYKGILLPLASSGDCTLREATIFASVLARVTIPANHSSVALLKLAQLPYNGATSLFIRVLLNKKYALPYRVIDALVDHFMTFTSEKRVLPVLWHQSLLVFAQRYRGDITRADKDRLKELMKAQYHHQITPEIRRQLFMGGCRGDPKTLASTPRSSATSAADKMAIA